jgi:hypothetical protein
MDASTSQWLAASGRGPLARRDRRSIGVRFDRLHVGVGQAEMMADLMDQHMGDDGTERLLMVAPVVEDRPAIQPDHARHLGRCVFGAERQAGTLEQPRSWQA